jgi:putative colanic acid biosynthesis acetyltransferase WcaF
MNIWAPWNVEIANDCWVGDQATLYSMALIKLGERSVVSQGSHLCCGTHDYNDPTFQLYAKPITVGDDAWVCAEAFICPGVTIGAGAVVGARAVATKDIPEWTVWAGNPCVQRGKRKFREKSVG